MASFVPSHPIASRRATSGYFKAQEASLEAWNSHPKSSRPQHCSPVARANNFQSLLCFLMAELKVNVPALELEKPFQYNTGHNFAPEGLGECSRSHPVHHPPHLVTFFFLAIGAFQLFKEEVYVLYRSCLRFFII